MSIRKARFHLHELECEVNSLNNKVKDLQKGIVLKSETIARLEKIKEKNEAVPSPFPTAALFNAGFSGLKLKPTTKSGLRDGRGTSSARTRTRNKGQE